MKFFAGFQYCTEAVTDDSLRGTTDVQMADDGSARDQTHAEGVRQQEAIPSLFKDTKTTKTTSPFTSTDLVIKVGHRAKTRAISLCAPRPS